MLLALLSAADKSKLSDAIDLVERNKHRWPVIRASTEGTEAFSSAHKSGPPGRAISLYLAYSAFKRFYHANSVA